MAMTESEIVKACIAKDPRAQRELYDLYAAAMMAICLRYMGARDMAEDVLQEGFIKVFGKIEQYTGENQLAGWIRTIMVNTSLIHLRKHKKFQQNVPVDDHFELSDQQWSVMQKIGHQELLGLVALLPDGYRTVFNLFAVEGYGHKEIAKQLDVTESTSKTQYKKARAWLQHKLLEVSEHEQRVYEQSKS